MGMMKTLVTPRVLKIKKKAFISSNVSKPGEGREIVLILCAFERVTTPGNYLFLE